MSIPLKEVPLDIHERDQDQNPAHRIKAVTFLLSGDGMIRDVNEAAGNILGYTAEYAGRHVSGILPSLTDMDLLEENGARVNPYLRFLSHIGHNFKVIAVDGRQFAGEVYFSDLGNTDQHHILVMIYPIWEVCQ
ncbi:MAG: hypothetical protein KIS65_03240 [Nitrosomonas sp.]|nr:hypothetical protein [Nitrosomonas sp.]